MGWNSLILLEERPKVRVFHRISQDLFHENDAQYKIQKLSTPSDKLSHHIIEK